MKFQILLKETIEPVDFYLNISTWLTLNYEGDYRLDCKYEYSYLRKIFIFDFKNENMILIFYLKFSEFIDKISIFDS